MNRRKFLQAATGAVLCGSASACRIVPRRPDGSPEPRPLDEFMSGGPPVMWCAPHPDDECFPGGLLARASIHYHCPLHFLVLTHGEGGECCLRRGCAPDLATVRGQEMKRAAEIYRASLEHEHFFNAPLPVESFPRRHEIWSRWLNYKDPRLLIATSIRRFRPQLLLTFHPDWGATGHPEHQLAARCAVAAAKLAADENIDLEGLPPHHIERTYFLLNRVWLLVLIGRADPGPVSEVFDATLEAEPGLTCVDFMRRATLVHRTQLRDMSAVRSHRWAFSSLSLRRVDPYREQYPPDQAVD